MAMTQQPSPSPSENSFRHYSEFPDLNVTFTPSEISDIRKSWNSMKDDPSAHEKATVHGTASAFFCQQFYENLLGEYPELKVLFPSIKGQASSMAGILSLVISQLDNLSRVNDILTSLGKRHSRIIGVEVEHYELVGNALLRTMHDRQGDDYTIELENAWIKLYSYIANLMLQAGEDPPAPQHALYPVLTPTSSMTSVSSRQQPPSQASQQQQHHQQSQGPPLQAPQPLHSNNVYNKANGTTNNDSKSGGTGQPQIHTQIQRPVATQASTSSNVGYDPSRSHFRSKNKKEKGKKNQDCVVM